MPSTEPTTTGKPGGVPPQRFADDFRQGRDGLARGCCGERRALDGAAAASATAPSSRRWRCGGEVAKASATADVWRRGVAESRPIQRRRCGNYGSERLCGTASRHSSRRLDASGFDCVLNGRRGKAPTPARPNAPFAAPLQDTAPTVPELDRARATAFADTVDALYGVISDQRRAATDHSRRMKWMLSIVVGALLATVAIGITQTVLLMRLTRETTAQQHRIEQLMQNQQAAMTSLLDAHLAMANAAADAPSAAPSAPTGCGTSRPRHSRRCYARQQAQSARARPQAQSGAHSLIDRAGREFARRSSAQPAAPHISRKSTYRIGSVRRGALVRA